VRYHAAMRTLSGASAALALALAAGCSLIVSTSGLSDGDDTAGDAATEVSTSPADAGPGDAPPDVRTEAGSETSVPFCKQAAHAFCDDFERQGPVAGGWTGMDVFSGGASLTLSNERAVSLPTSLRASHPARVAGAVGTTYAILERHTELTAQRVTIAFDIYVPKPAFQAGESTMGIACFGIRKGGSYDSVCISLAADYVAFAGSSGDPITFDAWVHVSASIDHGGMATATIGASQRSGPPTRQGQPATPDRIDLSIGLHAYNDPVSAFTAFYDNVTIDTQ
jgi:hypothetical protein